MCCTRLAHDCTWATWVYELGTVHGAVRKLQNILNCAFQCNYYYYYYGLTSPKWWRDGSNMSLKWPRPGIPIQGNKRAWNLALMDWMPELCFLFVTFLIKWDLQYPRQFCAIHPNSHGGLDYWLCFFDETWFYSQQYTWFEEALVKSEENNCRKGLLYHAQIPYSCAQNPIFLACYQKSETAGYRTWMFISLVLSVG